MSAAVPVRLPAHEAGAGRRCAQANAAAAGAIVSALIQAGVRHVVASPGARNIPMLLALEARTELDVITVIDERQAGFVALGLARTSGRPVAAVATSGSAAAHYLPAVLEACEDDIGLVLVSADRPIERHGFGAPQTLAQHAMLTPYVRKALTLEAPHSEQSVAWTAAAVADLVATAAGPRPGPVHLNAAFREPLWHPDVDPASPTGGDRRVSRSAPTVGDLDARRLADRLLLARRGLIVCGSRVGRELHADSVLELSERLGWPVLTDITSGLRFAGRGHLVTTHEALLSSPSFRAALDAPDLVLRFGREPVARPVWEWLCSLGEATERIHVNASGRWFDPAVNGGELVVSTPANFANAVGPLLSRPGFADPAWMSTWRAGDRQATAALAVACDDGFSEAAVACTLVDAMNDGNQLFAGNSMPIRDLDLFVRPRTLDLRVFSNRGVNGIDGHIATAIGLALGAPSAGTAALMGDVTALHDLGALPLAAATAAHVTLVVVDNSGGRIFEHLPIARHHRRGWFEERLATSEAARADIATIGRACGLRVQEATSTEELYAALHDELPRKESSLVVARVDPELSLRTRRGALATVHSRLRRGER